ncbi:Rz1-like spanin outer membrane subunit [Pseudomonas sp. JUb52]|uniref:Rz1-like spanin outer membrane subunit n=1 Tax=Pseudomonas sp. JUb52 TaxID=2485127 RepID=UPI003558A41D
MKSQRNGKPSSSPSLVMLLTLLLALGLLVSGCQSNLPTPKCVQSRVTVDPTLMAEPNYQTELLNFLSDKPSAPTSK